MLIVLYVSVHIILFVLPPVIGYIFDIYHKFSYTTNEQYYIFAYRYIVAYNLLFIISYHIFLKIRLDLGIFNFFAEIKYGNSYFLLNLSLLLLLLLFLVSIASKFILINIGAFSTSSIRGSGWYLQTLKMFADMAIVIMLFIGSHIAIYKERKMRVYFLYILFILIVSYFAFMSGSRFQVIVIPIMLIMVHHAYIMRSFSILVPVFFISFIFLITLFPVLSVFRSEMGLDLIESIQYTYSNNVFIYSIIDVFVSRLNYIDIVAKIFSELGDNIEIKSYYLINIIGLIPRLVWPEKPNMSYNTNTLGKELGMIGDDDDLTSVGLSIIGESYYILGLFGIIVAIFHAFLFYQIETIVNKKINPLRATMYIYFAVYVVAKDGYFAIIPGILQSLLVIAIFSIFLKKCKI